MSTHVRNSLKTVFVLLHDSLDALITFGSAFMMMQLAMGHKSTLQPLDILARITSSESEYSRSITIAGRCFEAAQEVPCGLMMAGKSAQTVLRESRIYWIFFCLSLLSVVVLAVVGLYATPQPSIEGEKQGIEAESCLAVPLSSRQVGMAVGALGMALVAGISASATSLAIMIAPLEFSASGTTRVQMGWASVIVLAMTIAHLALLLEVCTDLRWGGRDYAWPGATALPEEADELLEGERDTAPGLGRVTS